MAYLDHVTCVRFQTDSFQNSPLSPIRAKAASASDALFGRQAGLRRSPYHSFARRQPCCKPRTPPRGRFHCLHQRSTCCSDRNRSMVFQVKTMSLYQSRAGTAIWISPFDPSSRPFSTLQQHFQIAAAAGGIDLGVFVEHCSDAECVPNAVAIITPTFTGNAVGTAEKGAERHSSPFSCSTKDDLRTGAGEPHPPVSAT